MTEGRPGLRSDAIPHSQPAAGRSDRTLTALPRHSVNLKCDSFRPIADGRHLRHAPERPTISDRRNHIIIPWQGRVPIRKLLDGGVRRDAKHMRSAAAPIRTARERSMFARSTAPRSARRSCPESRAAQPAQQPWSARHRGWVIAIARSRPRSSLPRPEALRAVQVVLRP